jgi:hypothetical protein
MAGLCNYRVEVELRASSLATAQRLRAWGFSPDGPRHFSALLNQSDKLSVLARLLTELAGEVKDLSVSQLPDLPRPEAEPRRDSAPRLRGVAS